MERVRINNLTKNYSNQPIFHEVNVSFCSGQVIGLIGDNGVGKTTLLKLICGLIYPDRGEIIINGRDISRQHSKCMQGMGAFLEGSRSTYWRLTTWQNLLYFSGLKGSFGREAQSRSVKLLQLFDLWDMRDTKVELLSFGMKQRLALACSISHDPSIILLDEPTSGLDIQSSSIFENLINELMKENKLIIIASHDHVMIRRIAHRTFIINDGKLIHVP
jgi:ABC-type multidrug transport system ATPase subunit